MNLTGAQRGELNGMAATGRSLDISFVAIERYVDDLCAEEWVFTDDMGIARQLGVFG